MTIFSRSILKAAAGPFFLAVAVSTSFFVVNQIYVLMDLLLGEGVKVSQVGTLFLSYLPAIMAITVPMGCLFASQLAFGQLSAGSELTAMQACGVDLRRAALPLVLAAAVLTLGMVLFLDKVLPLGNRSYCQTYDAINRSRISVMIKPKVFIQEFSPYELFTRGRKGDDLEGVFIQKRGSRGEGSNWTITSARGRIQSRAEFRAVVLDLEAGLLQGLGPSGEGRYLSGGFRSARFLLPLPTPEGFYSPDNYRLLDIRELSRRRTEKLKEGNGAEARTYSREIQLRLTLAATCLLTVILGAPLGGVMRRGWGANFAVAWGIILAYEVLLVLGEDLMGQGVIGGGLGAWLPNLALGLAGGLLFLRWGRA